MVETGGSGMTTERMIRAVEAVAEKRRIINVLVGTFLRQYIKTTVGWEIRQNIVNAAAKQ